MRAGLEDPARRRTAFRYAGGIAVLQLGWLSRLVRVETGVLPSSSGLPYFVCLAALELAVPWWAERARATNWHPHHIAERYGLFTIILLGESVLAASRGVGRALEADAVGGSFVVIAVAGLILLFALWWLYFLGPAGDGLTERPSSSSCRCRSRRPGSAWPARSRRSRPSASCRSRRRSWTAAVRSRGDSTSRDVRHATGDESM